MPRNRQLTESRIREAAMDLLGRAGFESWGVNAIAREAGVDKVLIYRYFSSLEGLLEALVEETRFWPDPEALPNNSPEAFIGATLEAKSTEVNAHALLAHPSGRQNASLIRRKFTTELENWLGGFRDHARGSISASQLERLPALIHYQSSTGQRSLSPHELWQQVSPPLEWHGEEIHSFHEELPTELL
ncbi:MAG TPA: helix-turn-helix domain-containing protein [Oceanipulchritudo sp.]|nr:helix-turn-helix domain-containing protein [Oceanipulchritudo sp.]